MAIIRNYSESDNSNKKDISNSRKITKKMDLLDQKLNGLYKDIYISRPDNKNNISNILDKLDNAIDDIQSDNITVASMSELLRRIDSKDGSNVSKVMDGVADIFNDQNLVATLFKNDDINKYISSQNYQYDMICKYLPKLLTALKIKRDNVLCSDNFGKNFLNPKTNKSSKKEVVSFSSNCKKLENEYDLTTFIDKTYMNVSKYGEDFLYIVPYNVAISKLLKRQNIKRNTARLGQMSFYEQASNSVVLLKEGYTESQDFKLYKESVDDSSKFSFKGNNINLHFNESNVITDKLNDYIVIESKKDIEKLKSLSTIYEEKSLSDQFDKIKFDNDGLSASTNDGLVIPGNLDKDPDKIDKKMLGAVLERLPRENIVPIYIGKMCMGYYYLEFAEDKSACGFCGGHHMMPGISNSTSYAAEMSEDNQELAIRYIASRMSQAIDTKFINANKDLKEEIYAVLRYNEKFDISRSNDIGVTFIPAEDIVHCYTDIDEKTHRGISDLHNSVVPAMLYILLYLTDIIGKITRSTDKRIYYVKQNVETNVARTMMNVVQQIKKGNMGMRQIESMNNILNIVGKYNDYIIPLGQSGDPPIQFEVMNGQEINTPSEIMEKMEEAAINEIMPFEFVNSTMQQDFAIRFTMSNTRFLKDIYHCQRVAEKWISKTFTKIYNYEFGEFNSSIDVMLPPPIYLTMQNNQQLLDNALQEADKIVEFYLQDKSEEVQKEFKKLVVRNKLSTYIDFDDIDRYINTAEVNIKSAEEPKVEDGEASDSDMMDEDEY